MKVASFFYQHPVFNFSEFSQYLVQQGQPHLPTQRALLAYHKQQGHVLNIRRGLFATVPPLAEPDKLIVDPYLIAGRITEDAVLSYHSALDLHGMAYSMYYTFYFTSAQLIKLFTFQDHQFKRLIPPKAAYMGIQTKERQGLNIKVTSLERTLVDVLDKPEWGGGWEEIWRSLSSIAVLDIDQVIAYALALSNATTIAKVGFFLEQHQTQWAVSANQLEQLARHIPRSKHYFDTTHRHTGQYVSRWHLVIPSTIIQQQWEEPYADI